MADNNNGEGEWHTLNINDVNLSFYKKDSHGDYFCIEVADVERAQNGVRDAVIRSRQGMGVSSLKYSTKYYELFNTDFDAIELTVGNDSGFLLPKWRKAERTNDSYKYAIDLGTSNTFISRTRTGDNAAPEMFSMSNAMVSYLHDYNVRRQYSEVVCIEDAMDKPIGDAMKRNLFRLSLMVWTINSRYVRQYVRLVISLTNQNCLITIISLSSMKR